MIHTSIVVNASKEDGRRVVVALRHGGRGISGNDVEQIVTMILEIVWLWLFLGVIVVNNSCYNDV